MATSNACRFCVAVLLCATTLQGWAAVTDRAERRQAAREVRQETRQGARQTKQQGRERARDIKY